MKYGPGSAVTGNCPLVVPSDDFLQCQISLSRGTSLPKQRVRFVSTRRRKHMSIVEFLNRSRAVSRSSKLRSMKKSKLEDCPLCDTMEQSGEELCQGTPSIPWLYKHSPGRESNLPKAAQPVSGQWSIRAWLWSP